MAKQTMPGPGHWRSFKIALQIKRNYIQPLAKLFADYGDYVAFKSLVGVPVIALTHPDGVEHVLKRNAKNYLKPISMRQLEPVLGKGLLTSDGEEWKKHRQIIAPEFSHKKMELYFPIMQRHLELMVHQWRKENQPFDVAPAIAKTTYGIAGECFFGVDLGDTSEIIYHSIELASSVAVKRMTLPVNIPIWFPLAAHRRMKNAIRDMNEIVYRILDERANSASEAQDVLSRLTKINRETGAPQLTREQIRDEVMTLLLAGHETTGNSLSWTLYLLGKYPQVQDRLREEILSVVAGEIPTLSELKHLPFTKMVVEESMRLYPPAATIARQAITRDEISDYEIAPNTIVNLAQWITHRHPDFWRQPEEFIPERFAKPEDIHPYAYFPFAAGPRECVGKNMAMIEAIALLAGMIRNFRFELLSQDVGIRALITIRPDPGVVMRLTPVGGSRVRGPSRELTN